MRAIGCCDTRGMEDAVITAMTVAMSVPDIMHFLHVQASNLLQYELRSKSHRGSEWFEQLTFHTMPIRDATDPIHSEILLSRDNRHSEAVNQISSQLYRQHEYAKGLSCYWIETKHVSLTLLSITA